MWKCKPSGLMPVVVDTENDSVKCCHYYHQIFIDISVSLGLLQIHLSLLLLLLFCFVTQPLVPSVFGSRPRQTSAVPASQEREERQQFPR